MKKTLSILLFGIATAAFGQWAPIQDHWTRVDGGNAVASGYGTVQDEAIDLTTRPKINCVGAGITCADDAGNAVTTITVPGAAAAGYQTVQDEGVAVAQETVLNCVGAGIACTAGAGKTTITVGGAAGGVTLQGAYPGTPDTGHANITGTYGATQNNIHNTLSNFGLSLENNQAALVGQTREYSPGIRFLGAAWDTDGAVSNTNAWQLFARPINGNTTSIDLVWAASLGGGAYTTKMYLSSGGDLTLGASGVSDGTLTFNNATSGSIMLTPPAGALGGRTLTLPLATATLATQTAAETFTNKTLTVPSIDNGATSAGSARFLEDSDNGTNYVAVIGQESIAANATVRLPAPRATSILGYQNGPDQIYYHEDFLCGAASATGIVGQCLNWAMLVSGGAWSAPITGLTTTLGEARCTADATNDECGMASTVPQILLMDGWRWRARIKLSALSDDTEKYIVYAGGTDMAANNTTAPTNGVFFSYTNDTANTTPNWMFNSWDSGADTGPTSCGIAVTTNFTALDIWYDAATGLHFYVDGVECSGSPSATTDLPATAGEEIRWNTIKFVKTTHNGTATTFDVDYVTIGPTLVTR